MEVFPFSECKGNAFPSHHQIRSTNRLFHSTNRCNYRFVYITVAL